MTIFKQIKAVFEVSIEYVPGYHVAPSLTARSVGVKLNDRYIVRDIDLSMHQNEILAVIGPSRCGKSTLISALNRMIEYTLPTARVVGSIALSDEQIVPAVYDATHIRRRAGMVFQRPNPFPLFHPA